MDAFESVATKLDIREFSPKQVPPEIKSNVLEAARLTGTGLNTQHWRFILVENKENLKSQQRTALVEIGLQTVNLL